jgi:hypothetical protein
MTQKSADRHPSAMVEPRAKLLPAPLVHPDLTPLAALAVADDERPAGRVEVSLSKTQSL